MRVLHLSDMHLEHLSVSPEQLRTTVDQQPIELIALTGDFLDRRRSLAKLPAYLEALQALNPTYGIYAVLGNHDYLLSERARSELRALFAAYRVTLLQNEHVTLDVAGQTLHIIGIDDFCSGHADVRRSFAGLADAPEGYRLVLTHDPNVVLTMAQAPFHYLLAGLFHGGQIHWPKPYHLWKMGKLARQKRVRGLHFEHGRPFYISEGLGQTGVPLRLGSRPEVALHELQLCKQYD
jgi:predicted MPP superfamily phosphohydrolase